MGLCYSLRSRLAAAHPSVPYGGRGEADPAAAEQQQQCGDPQVRHRLRQDLVAKERADKKRSKSIDKTLKAEKREYKQTHRLLLLGERGAGGGGEPAAPGRCGAARPGVAVSRGCRSSAPGRAVGGGCRRPGRAALTWRRRLSASRLRAGRAGRCGAGAAGGARGSRTPRGCWRGCCCVPSPALVAGTAGKGAASRRCGCSVRRKREAFCVR